MKKHTYKNPRELDQITWTGMYTQHDSSTLKLDWCSINKIIVLKMTNNEEDAYDEFESWYYRKADFVVV